MTMAYHGYSLGWGIRPEANVPSFLKNIYTISYSSSSVVEKIAYNSVKVFFKPNARLIEPTRVDLTVINVANVIILENSFATNLPASS